jgi:hypothetical protein
VTGQEHKWSAIEEVLIDESHNSRNREGKRYKVIQEYIQKNTSKCILLSATPYNKSYVDLSSQLQLFVDGDHLLLRFVVQLSCFHCGGVLSECATLEERSRSAMRARRSKSNPSGSPSGTKIRIVKGSGIYVTSSVMQLLRPWPFVESVSGNAPRNRVWKQCSA